jgi:hypothetical protein
MNRLDRVTVGELEAQSRLLERQIKKLERRGFHITPPELERETELKKLRLLAKDRLHALRHAS